MSRNGRIKRVTALDIVEPQPLVVKQHGQVFAVGRGHGIARRVAPLGLTGFFKRQGGGCEGVIDVIEAWERDSRAPHPLRCDEFEGSAVQTVQIDAPGKRVSFSRGRLPETLDWLRLTDLAIGDARIDIRLERHQHDTGVTVLRREGHVEIVTVK